MSLVFHQHAADSSQPSISVRVAVIVRLALLGGLLSVVLFLVLACPSFAETRYSRTSPADAPVVQYTIQARLEPPRRRIEGTILLSWRNTTPRKVNRLCFHLYLNALSSESTVYYRESAAISHDADDHKLTADEAGYSTIQHILSGNGEILHYAYGSDPTVLWVDLKRPIGKNGTIQLRYSFEARLPSVFMRSGGYGDYFLVGQWFPKIAVLTPSGWTCYPYHALGEFFANFGRYDVTLQVPKDYVIDATGTRVSSRTEGSWRTVRFQADAVHDFVWVTSPDLRVVKDRWRTVRLSFLYPPGHGLAMGRFDRAVKDAFSWFQQTVGPYPYDRLVVVDPPIAALKTGGMEYPAFITVGLGLRTPRWFHFPELIAFHEFAHQYWYGIIANDEVDYPWLDEGLATYSEDRLMTARFGARAIDVPFIGLWGYHHEIFMLRNDPHSLILPPDSPAWTFPSFRSYATAAYFRPALMLLSLERIFGKQAMQTFLKTYYRKFRFRHPRPQDLLDTLHTTMGPRAAQFARTLLKTTAVVDHAVQSVSCRPDRTLGGYTHKVDQRIFVPSKVIPNRFACSIRLRRHGNLAWPVDYDVTLLDGTVFHETWPADRTFLRWSRHNLTSQVASVRIDPYNRLLVDWNLANNGWQLRTSSRLRGAKYRWWTFLAEVLSFIVGLG